MPTRKLVRDSVLFTAANYVVRAALMVRGVVAAGLLGPAAYGGWNALMLLLDYGALASVGTQQGVDQLVPQRLGQGDPGGAVRAMRAALFNLIALSAVYALLVLGWLHGGKRGQILTHWGDAGVLLALGLVLLVNLSNYKLSVSRSHGDMMAVSTWFLLQGGVGTALGLSLIPGLGAWGLLWGWAAGTLLAFVWIAVRSRRVVEMQPIPSVDSLELIRVGFPMYLFVASTLVMRSLDRLVILRFLGTESLGLYSLAVMALTFLLYFPDSLNYVLYPSFVRRFQAMGRDPAAIRNPLERVLAVMATALPALCGVAFIVAREVAFALLPRFAEGATAARILCFGAAPLAIANLSSIVLMTLGRQAALAPIAIAGVALGFTLDVQLLMRGQGITGVAWATLATFVFHAVVLLWFAVGGLGEPPAARARFIARMLLPWLAALLLAEGIDQLLGFTGLVGGWRTVLRLTLGVIAFLGVYLALFRGLFRSARVPELLAEFDLARLVPWRRRNGAPGA